MESNADYFATQCAGCEGWELRVCKKGFFKSSMHCEVCKSDHTGYHIPEQFSPGKKGLDEVGAFVKVMRRLQNTGEPMAQGVKNEK